MRATSFPEDFKRCRPNIKWNKEISHQKKASALRVYFLISFSTSSKRIVKVLYNTHTHTIFTYILAHTYTWTYLLFRHTSTWILGWRRFHLPTWIIFSNGNKHNDRHSHYEKGVHDSMEEIHRVTSISAIFSKFLVFYHSGSCVWRYINFAHLNQGGFTTNIYVSKATNELHALCLHQ